MVILTKLFRAQSIILSKSGVREASTVPPKLSIAELINRDVGKEGLPVHVTGLIRTIRKQKRVAFAALQDGSSIRTIQVVLNPRQAYSLSTGSAVAIDGKWLPSQGGVAQAFELHAEAVKVGGETDASTNPIQKKFQTNEFLRTVPHLRVRTVGHALLLRLRSQTIAHVTEYFNQHGFVQTHTPIITSSDCEGAGEVFMVDSNRTRRKATTPLECHADYMVPFFGAAKYLTVSGQLHLEALAQSVGKVWTLSPTFRAERSDTARHLSEFYMLEAEIAFIDDLEVVMGVVEDLIRHIANRLLHSTIGQELNIWRVSKGTGRTSEGIENPLEESLLSSRWRQLLQDPWPRLTFNEACSILRRHQREGKVTFDVSPDETTGIQTEHERYLSNVLAKGPIFITNYPKSMKPFYMLPSPSPSAELGSFPTVSCFDLLLPEVCEVVGGSMREHRYDHLNSAMREFGLSEQGEHFPENGSTQYNANRVSTLDWYLELRKYGSMPHGGFGLGFDRLLAFLAGVNNVRDVVTFPRYHNQALC